MLYFFFFNDTATTEIYTLSLHDALPISETLAASARCNFASTSAGWQQIWRSRSSEVRMWKRSLLSSSRSEEHTSELQSQSNLVCRLLLEKKKADVEAFPALHPSRQWQHH